MLLYTVQCTGAVLRLMVGWNAGPELANQRRSMSADSSVHCTGAVLRPMVGWNAGPELAGIVRALCCTVDPLTPQSQGLAI